jgi:sterol desaturase/sphingolipid hydroxylase (fatty acid hydroxylase superfamily)
MLRYTKDCLEAAEGRWPAEDHSQPRSAARSGQRPAQRPKTIRVFENGFLEGISRAHPITPAVWYGPFIAWCWLAWPAKVGWAYTAESFFWGFLGFSLFEYLLHRFVFHGFIRAARDIPSRFRAFMAHGYHHEFPDDKMRLVMPPMISWPLAIAFTGLFYLCLGPTRFFPPLTGFMAGYIAYDWVHYYTHHFHPRGGIGKWMRVYHLRHHHQDPNAHFGVSSPLWDVPFRTFRSPLETRQPQANEASSHAA